MPRGPGRAMVPQPASAANKRGPKSRAGLKHACVKGAMTAMSTATVRPMNTGASRPAGAALLRSSVTANTTRARMRVPSSSAANAAGSETSSFSRAWSSCL